MAIYAFTCPVHGDFEEIRPINKFSRSAKCPECGKASAFHISPVGKPMVDFTEGWNGGAGKFFGRKVERDNWMRENNMERC